MRIIHPRNQSEPTESERKHYNHLFTILRRVSIYLTNSEMINILCLNKYTSIHLPNNEFLGIFVVNYLSTLFQTPISQETAISFFKQYSGIIANSLADIVAICKDSKNLIKNPCGALDFEHWERTDGGHGWTVENFLTFNKNRTCFASSYEWCKLQTEIDLRPFIAANLKKQNMKLLVGSPVSRRFDCGSVAKLVITIFRSKSQNHKFEKIVHPSWAEGSSSTVPCPWELMSEAIDLHPDSLKATIEFLGKDEKWWAGFYGARFGYCYARVLYY